MRLLGLDVGERRIGVAISDLNGLLAFPLCILQCQEKGKDMDEVARLVAENSAYGVVVGLPRSLSGETGPQAEKVLAFVVNLKGRVTVPVYTYDERLSTVAAHRHSQNTGSGGRRKVKRPVRKHLDADAAAIILQGYLDWQRGTS
ncbi:MAG: Holliday junction resolvase RuvX [Dehalococcoidia bacterium]|jgi:putative Holliday junction resolvase|nr:Holliday junction resolvase RuvX [Dehalococcoidia bacterium]